MAFALYLLTGLAMAAAPPVSQAGGIAQAPGGTSSVSDEAQPGAPTGIAPVLSASERQLAAQQLNEELHQRYLGVLPDFYTTDNPNALPLMPEQKILLALRSEVDPLGFLGVAGNAAVSQIEHDFPSYGQGARGYAKRLEAAYLDDFSSSVFGGAVFPILLHQDPRYFRKGEGSIRSRAYYAVLANFRCKDDRGYWVPNYSNILGNIAAGAVANAYYPASDRGIGLTLDRAFAVSAEGALGTVFEEFWPDIAQKVFHRKR